LKDEEYNLRSKRRVVVTGLGILSPLGLSVKETWDNLLKGKSGVSAVTSFDASALPVRINAVVPGYNPDNYLPPKESRKIDQFIQYAYVAAKQALEDSGLLITEENSPEWVWPLVLAWVVCQL
jgi:3-oxoacyl-[acyl-carrier-protein] synthase II